MAYITESQRYQLEILLKQHYSIRQAADALGHKYHTIYQEIRRGTVKQLDTHLKAHDVYKADYAQLVVTRSLSNRGRDLKIGSDHALAAYIEDMIKNRKYSPEALLLHAEAQGLPFQTRLCCKTIYNYINRGLFLNISCHDLPYKKPAKKKKNTQKRRIALNHRKGCSIEQRPEEIRQRREYGHWEMDTVVGGRGKGRSCLLVLSERMTREEIILKIRSREASSVVRALDALERRLGRRKFRETFKTITCDNGVEFLDAEGIQKQDRTTLYYCHPYSSWERGTNENCNRMIRRFFPKGTNFDGVLPAQVAFVQDWINHYPRKILGGISSRQYRETLASGIV